MQPAAVQEHDGHEGGEDFVSIGREAVNVDDFLLRGVSAELKRDDLLAKLDLDLKSGVAKLLDPRGHEAVLGVDDALGQRLELQDVEKRRGVDADQGDR